MILRSILFFGVLTSAALAPVYVFILCACGYAVLYRAHELIFLCLLIDTLYGSGYPIHLPYYTLVAIAGVFIIEWVKPHISVYNQ
jgi:hypothetical protein